MTSYICIPIPYNEKDFFFFFLVLVLEGLVGLYKNIKNKNKNKKHSASLASVVGCRLKLLCDVEWFALEMNKDHSVIFETCSRYRIFSFFLVHVSKQLCCPAFPHLIVNFSSFNCQIYTVDKSSGIHFTAQIISFFVC